MGEKRVDIKIYTVLFFMILIGFLSFLVYQGCRDSEYRERLAPKEKFKKNKDNVLNYITVTVDNRV
ncbi:MAG: hypothetical protein WCK13_00105 [Ignavibacteriota bacterium]|nr:hypothetical protein [Ignavibacteriota bacterium]